MTQTFDGKTPPNVEQVYTPKVSEIGLRYGQFIGYPLRPPVRNRFEVQAPYEGTRFVVLAMEPDERPEMAWTAKIKAGDNVTMMEGVHMVGMRMNLSDAVELGPYNKEIGDAFLLNSGQILAWDSRPLRYSEFDDASGILQMLRSEQIAERQMDQRHNA